MNAAPAVTAAKGRHGRSAGAGEAKAAPTSAEPRWLAEVRLRAARRVLWMRHLRSDQGYRDERSLAIGQGEVDRALAPMSTAADAERAFYQANEQAKELTATIGALNGSRADAQLEHIVATFA